MTDITLYLLRHGESTANLNDIFASHRVDAALAESGIRQARRWAGELKRFPISGIYSSPLLRAKQTAEIACQPLNVEPVFTDALAEIDVGDLEGQPHTDPRNMAAFRRVLSLWANGSYGEGFSGGETFLDVEKRLQDLGYF